MASDFSASGMFGGLCVYGDGSFFDTGLSRAVRAAIVRAAASARRKFELRYLYGPQQLYAIIDDICPEVDLL